MTRHPALSRRQAVASMLAALAGAPLLGRAEGGPIRFVLPNAAGSGVDAIARAAQNALSKSFGAPVVIDNQPGAGGVLGLQLLARAAADGNTLSLVSNNVVIFPSVLKSLPFNMPGDFAPVAVIGSTPMVLVVNAARVPATNSREFVALLKSKPGQLNFGSGGNGTILHLASELYLEAAGASAKHIPYRGVGPMLADLVGGQIDFATTALNTVQGQIRSGTLRALGMYTPQRTPAAPDIPTLAEQGLPNFAVDAWFAVLGPKGLGADAVRKANAAIVATFDDPQVKVAMAKQGNTVQVSTPEQAQAMFRSELAKYALLVKKIGLQPE